MADLLCEKVQQPAPRIKNGKESKCQGDEDADVIFVGVEHANEEADIVFVREISRPKVIISRVLNRIAPGSGAKSRKRLMSDGMEHAWKSATEVAPTSKGVDNLQVSQPESRSTDDPIVMEHSLKSDCNRSPLLVLPHGSSDRLSPLLQNPVGAAISVDGKEESSHNSKRRPPSDVKSGNSKRPKLSEDIAEECSSDTFSGIFSTIDPGKHPKVDPTSFNHVQNGALSPWACPNDKAHLDLMNSEIANSFGEPAKTDILSTKSQSKTFSSKEGNRIMLLGDFFYGQHEGEGQPEEQTHANFKCASCLKVLKNVTFMKHMKQHLEIEKERGDSWEIHTTCQNCHRLFLTPLQLQRHIESVHIQEELSSVCKICELSFETDQVLLQHMKDTHKPGEMPYVCQVCNYRSSVFADVETHFRARHENSKNLMCPFCLKIFKTSVSYVSHCWRHWNNRVYRCSKCRLLFLTSKEKMEHVTRNHQTFKMPEQLAGLPPETKVIIQSAVQPGSRDAASIIVSITHN